MFVSLLAVYINRTEEASDWHTLQTAVSASATRVAILEIPEPLVPPTVPVFTPKDDLLLRQFMRYWHDT